MFEGRYLTEGRRLDPAEATRWYLKAADQGETRAQTELAGMYETGFGVEQEDVEAARWYGKAGDRGDRSAQFVLGGIYEKGKGVPQDYAEAVRWYRLAADQGDADAQYNLGLMYAKGLRRLTAPSKLQRQTDLQRCC